MKAPVVAGFLVAVGVGFAAGMMFGPGGGPRPSPSSPSGTEMAEVSVLRARVEKLQVLLDEANHRRAAATASSPAMPAATPADPGERRPHDPIADINAAQGRTNTEQAGEIAALKADIARLQATLPEPQVLKDLRAAPLDEVIALAGAIRKDVQERLLTPPPSLAARFSSFLQRSDTGTARILPRGKYVHVIEKREGGAYWSFVTKDNDYNKEPDLALEGTEFQSGFYGNSKGFILELGDLGVDQIGSGPSPPPGLDEGQRERWDFLWSDSPFTGAESWRKNMGPLNVFREKAATLGLDGRAPAAVGRTYLLRSQLPDEHEILVVFQVADADDTGMNLVWQVLKNWNIPRGR